MAQNPDRQGKAWYAEVLLGSLILVYGALREASSRVIFQHLAGKSHSIYSVFNTVLDMQELVLI